MIYYVYIHRRLDTNEVFYVGVGHLKQSSDSYRRAYSYKRRNAHWNSVVKLHGRSVEIFAEFDLKEEAFQTEINLITKYGRRDLGTGSLVNLTEGGEAPKNFSPRTTAKATAHKIGRSLSDEAKKKLSLFNKGKVVSEYTKAKISKARKGMVFPAEHKANLSKASIGNKRRAIKILDTKTQVVYNAIYEAAEALGVHKDTVSNWLSGKSKNKSSLVYL